MTDPCPSPADPACIGVRWCQALLDGLAAGGVRRLVLSPGSRSTPVVLAAQRQARLELTPILDERSAGFHALGMARATRRPVALLATSGSAPAHWYPAVIESSESGVPLILISADRPPELRGWGANQTVDQTGLFGPHVRAFFDPGAPRDGSQALKTLGVLGLRAAATSRGPSPGPVHINLPLREPLVPSSDCGPSPSRLSIGAMLPEDRLGSVPPGPALAHRLAAQLAGGLGTRGLILCGPGDYATDFPPALDRCAQALGVPVLADPLSGLRFGPGSGGRLARYNSFLRNPWAARALRPDWVLRFGRAPVSRTLSEWLTGVPSLLVDPVGRWVDPTHDLVCRLSSDPVALCLQWAAEPWSAAEPDWRDRWTGAERRAAELARDLVDSAPWFEAQPIAELIGALAPGEGLFCANSLPIRQLDTWSGCREAPLQVFGNRGASGIDGQMSTLSGLNAGGIPTVGLLGDLSFLHDLSGLTLAARLDRPCIVLNNGGGRIFDYLPQRGLPDFERLWRTPAGLDLGALAKPFGLAHRRVDDAVAWRQALAEGLASGRGCLIEVMIDAPRSHELHLDYWRRVGAHGALD